MVRGGWPDHESGPWWIGVRLGAHKEKTIDAIQKVINAMQAVIKSTVIQEGYNMCGQYPFSFEKVLLTCTRQFSLGEWDRIIAAREELECIMESRGRITEDEMDQLELVNFNHLDTRNAVPKDKRALQNQRACIMNSDDAIANYRDYHRVKAAKEAEKVRRANQAPAARVAESAAGKAAKRASKEAVQAAKRVHAVFWATLSRAQKVAWNKENRPAKRARVEAVAEPVEAGDEIDDFEMMGGDLDESFNSDDDHIV